MDIKVSIICNTFNHEDYIKDALNGFVMQKCNFKYEILIHDDASTDETPSIIREYQKKYPEIIFPIYQTENQYSKKISITKTYQIPRAKGKYIAICEGDDFWTDEYKLQKQYDAMEKHPNIDICAHKTTMLKNEKFFKYIAPAQSDKIFNVDEVIAGGGGFVATNSLFIKKACFDKEYEFEKIRYYDYVIQIKCSLRGGMLYLNDNMSVYRYMAIGSWTVNMITNPDKSIINKERSYNMLCTLNEETEFKYNATINKRLLKLEYELLCLKGQYNKVLHNKKILKSLSCKEKIKLIIKIIKSYCIF